MSKFSPNQHPSVVPVLQQMLLRAPSGLKAQVIAELVGKPYPTLMSELSQQQGHKLGADMILPITSATNSFAAIEFLAHECGGVFLRLPHVAENGGALASSLAASAKEYSEFMQETAVSISDGKVPRDQLDRITKEGHEAVEAILSMMKLARVTHEAQFGG